MSRESFLLTPFVQAAAPVVAVSTHEEGRFTKAVVKAFPQHTVLSISSIGGLKEHKPTAVAVVDKESAYNKAISTVAARGDAILLVFDLQHILHNAPIYRHLKDTVAQLKSKGAMVVLVAPDWKLPEELRIDVRVLNWGLPTRAELRTSLVQVANAVQHRVPSEDETALLDAAAGLAQEQAEEAFSLSYISTGRFDANKVAEVKMQLVRTEGLLEIWRPVAPNQVGGLGKFKKYLDDEVVPWKDDDQLRTRGILMVGVPGTGKSLSMKVCGALLGWPIVRMDVSSLKGSLVGQSEANMRKALKTTTAVAPVILGLDELEKGIGGYQSSAITDSGVTLGMLGTLLTWMQENTAPVLVVATCNDYAKLPPELVRRFDTSWFMDLPRPVERTEIAEIHLLDVRCKYDQTLLRKIVTQTEGYTGDEIRQMVLTLARLSRRDPTLEMVSDVASSMKPLSISRGAEIDKLRGWADQCIRIANTVEAGPTTARKMRRDEAGDN